MASVDFTLDELPSESVKSPCHDLEACFREHEGEKQPGERAMSQLKGTNTNSLFLSFAFVVFSLTTSALLTMSHQSYNSGNFDEARALCEQILHAEPRRTDNLLLLGATMFQMRNFTSCIHFNQQAINIDPNFAGRVHDARFALKCHV
jgi:tetratricopeptide (TPR) repeat protein